MILVLDILQGGKPSSRQQLYCPQNFLPELAVYQARSPGWIFSVSGLGPKFFMFGIIASPNRAGSGIVSNNSIRTKIREYNNFLQAIRFFASSILADLGRSRPVAPDCMHALWGAIVHWPPIWRSHVRVSPAATTGRPPQSRALFPRARGKRTTRDIT